MPEVGDHYIRAEILLPRGDQMVRGNVAGRSIDVNGNVMASSHTNSVLDMMLYQVQFAGGKVTELPNVMQMGISIYSWMCWLIIGKITMYGQTSNPSDHCRLAYLLPVEG